MSDKNNKHDSLDYTENPKSEHTVTTENKSSNSKPASSTPPLPLKKK